MSRAKTSFRRAVEAHREARGLLAVVRDRLEWLESESEHGADSVRRQTALAAQLEQTASYLAPGWLGTEWAFVDRGRMATGVDAEPGRPAMVRIGDAAPLPGVGFPVVVPLVGVGHLAIDRDARDPAVTGLLRSLLTRLLASFPAGSLRILAVDGGALGAVFTPFRALVPVDVMSEPVTDVEGLRQVLERGEEQVRQVQSGGGPDPEVLLIVAAALPPGTGRTELARIAALAHAGPAARVHLVLAGYPPGDASRSARPTLERTTSLTGSKGIFRLGDPPGEVLGAAGLNAPVTPDQQPAADLVAELCRSIAGRADVDRAMNFDDLIPTELWTESSVDGLTAVIGRLGRIGRTPAQISLDDATPHWLIGGRTGSGKTVFLLDVLYSLAARYSPDELALYLLDFKEGISFTEFVPTDRDPTWIPHARTVGVESDREYGLAVLRELVREMGRRASAMKQSGVTNLAQLRASRRDLALPRILTVIDEFHVLFQGGDHTSKEAAVLLEEISRKGRSYGVHLVLASQSVSGIDALLGKGSAVFGQFGMRVALNGGGTVLDIGNQAADDLPRGMALLNDAGGVKAGNRLARFPDADRHSIALLRHRVWQLRTPGSLGPSVFIGYAEHLLEKDADYVRLTPDVRRRSALVGRAIDVNLPSVGASMDAVPGAHLAVLGTSPVGVDVLHAAVLSLAEQHYPGQARFVLAGFAPVADDVVDELGARLERDGHLHEELGITDYRDWLARAARGEMSDVVTYLAVFGADAASPSLQFKAEGPKRTGIDDLRSVLREGPMRNLHVLGWWRGVRRLVEDIGLGGKDDVANVLALNVRGEDLSSLLGQFNIEWVPRTNRALLFNRHDDSQRLLVPFVRPGRLEDV